MGTMVPMLIIEKRRDQRQSAKIAIEPNKHNMQLTRVLKLIKSFYICLFLLLGP
jgi:hypothetical protein